MKAINSHKDLLKLKKSLGVREDWHEPDEQDVTVGIQGGTFDNAGSSSELTILVLKGNKPVASVNLATLFAYATGYRD